LNRQISKYPIFISNRPKSVRFFLANIRSLVYKNNLVQSKENTATNCIKQPVTALFWHPRRESNSQLTLRRGLLYPFNYGGISLSEPPYFSTENQTLSIDPSPYNQGPPTHRPFAAKRLDFRPSENHLSRSHPRPAGLSPKGSAFFRRKKHLIRPTSLRPPKPGRW
jgi:hypothetical protein